MDLSQLISQSLPDNLLAQIGQQAGISSPQESVHASKSVITTLLQGLLSNSEQPGGLQSILGALDRDHNGSILNDILGLVTGQVSAPNDRAGNGAGILGHIFGDRQSNVTQSVSQVLGIDSGKIMQLMITLAPLVLGLLGKLRANNSLQADNFPQVVGAAAQQHVDEHPGYGIFGKLLDRNGDGNMTDDLLQMGMKFFMRQ